jgi:hypothetical protein
MRQWLRRRRPKVAHMDLPTAVEVSSAKMDLFRKGYIYTHCDGDCQETRLFSPIVINKHSSSPVRRYRCTVCSWVTAFPKIK